MAMLFFVAACGKKENATDWRKQLRINEKQPYDLYLSYKHLKDIFPQSNITEQYKIFGNHMSYVYVPDSDSIELKIITGHSIDFTEDELLALRRFVQQGNYVLIAAWELGDVFYNELNIKMLDHILEPVYYRSESETSDISGLADTVANNLHVTNLPNAGKKVDSFTYVGPCFDRFLTYPNNEAELNENVTKKFDFVYREDSSVLATQMYDGAGKFIFVASPIPFTNHFMLSKDGPRFTSKLLSAFPEDIKKVTWHAYQYRTAASEDDGGINNPLSGLMKYPMWRNAIILTLIGLVLYALILARRKQRSVPVIPQVKNDSLEFVESVGHLYFNKGDNKNICIKMAIHFLDYLKVKYNLPFLRYDDEFVTRVSSKSASTKEQVQEIFNTIAATNNQEMVTEEQVAYLYQLIRDFKTKK
jgi:hypothetical protein